MDAGVSAGRAAHVVFEDGIGERLSSRGGGNEPLEVLKISNELSAVSAFEPSLREQSLRLHEFRHEAFARVRGVERLDARTSTVVIISERVRGVRLSELLAVVEREAIPVELNAALCLIRQLVAAVAALHEAAPDSCHGAIAPERLVITPEGKLVLVEYMMGPALEELHFSQERYWKELGIALPHTFGLPRFDLFADVTQMGAVSLALLLGRRSRSKSTAARISDVVDQASTRAESERRTAAGAFAGVAAERDATGAPALVRVGRRCKEGSRDRAQPGQPGGRAHGPQEPDHQLRGRGAGGPRQQYSGDGRTRASGAAGAGGAAGRDTGGRVDPGPVGAGRTAGRDTSRDARRCPLPRQSSRRRQSRR